MTVLAKLQALSNETRFKIVDLVREREMTAGGIARHFKLTRPGVSQHIGILRDAGLLDERRVGAKRVSSRASSVSATPPLGHRAGNQKFVPGTRELTFVPEHESEKFAPVD